MLQFITGVATLNINFIAAALVSGGRFYNSPPLFFVALFVLLSTGFYSLHLRRDIVTLLGALAVIGTVAGVLNGFDGWHMRQTIAFISACLIWVFLYHTAWESDVFTLERTYVILCVYAAYWVLVSFEKTVFETYGLSYLISCVTSVACGQSNAYVMQGRYPFFSTEASTAALAITATIMPFLCARVVTRRSVVDYLWFGLAAFLLYKAEGLTGQTLLAYSIGFLIFPRLAVAAVPSVMAVIVVGSSLLTSVLSDRLAFVNLVTDWFGGIYSRVDEGIESGSYTARAMNWIIGAKAFLSSPLLGVGIGGTQTQYYLLANNPDYDILLGEEQESVADGSFAAYSSPLVVRIPAELGLVGVSVLLYYGWKTMRFVMRRDFSDPLSQYALMYIFGAMMLSFCFEGTLLNPVISAFAVLYAQARRREAATDTPRMPDLAMAAAPA